MKASIELQRSDLIRVTLRMFPRHPANRNFLLLLAGVITLWQLWGEPLFSHSSLLLALLTGLLAALAGLLAGLGIQLLGLLWSAGRQPGVLGRHEFELTAEGIIERTAVNEGMAHWTAVPALLVLPDYLLLQTGAGLHILPRRSFSGEVDFDQFCAEARRLRAAAGVTGEAPRSHWLLATALAVPVLLALLWLTSYQPATLEAALTDEVSDFRQRQAELLAGLQIGEVREVRSGSRLRLLGSLHNAGNHKASGIQIEVELFDAAGQFIYECSEYISRELAPGERENFQVSCGCGQNAAPEHASRTVRVVSAHNYD